MCVCVEKPMFPNYTLSVSACSDVIRPTSPISLVLGIELLQLELEFDPTTSHSQVCTPPYVPKLYFVCF